MKGAFRVLPFLFLALGLLLGPGEAAQRGPGEISAQSDELGAGSSPLIESIRKSLYDFVSADRNRDGLVTSAEAEAYFEARFAVMDADRDGRLSGVEFVRDGMLKSDLAISGLRTGRFSKFEQLDLDHDGSVSPEEFLFERRLREAASGGWAVKERQRREALFSRLDTDGTGFVDKSGFVAAGAGYFDAVDLDRDGQVTIWQFLAGQRL